MGDVEITIDGLDELTADLEKLVSKYPDKAGDLLKKSAKEFRKDYVHNVRQDAKHLSGNKASLGKLKNTKVYPIRGIGKNQYVEIGSTAPHYHLFERGHNKVTPGGRDVGFVEGRHTMEKTIKDYEEELPKVAQHMIDELLKEGGFQ